MTTKFQYQELAYPIPGYPAVGPSVTADSWFRAPQIPTRRSFSLIRRIGRFTINLDPLGSPSAMDIAPEEAVACQPQPPARIRRKSILANPFNFDPTPPIPQIPEVMSAASWMPRLSIKRRRNPAMQSSMGETSPIQPPAPTPDVRIEQPRRKQPGQSHSFLFEPVRPNPEPSIDTPPSQPRKRRLRLPGCYGHNPVPEIVPDLRSEQTTPRQKRRLRPAQRITLDPIPEQQSNLDQSICAVIPKRSKRREANRGQYLSLLFDVTTRGELPEIICLAPSSRTGRKPIAGGLTLVDCPPPRAEILLALPTIHRKRLLPGGCFALSALPIPEVPASVDYWHTQPQSSRRKLSRAAQLRALLARNTSGGTVAVPISATASLGLSAIYLEAAAVFVPGFEAADVIGGER